ncbi:MAG TPA: hypothetical protein VGH91_05560 [Gammaproteobacteria bacterium]|jgi:hypothetical protein
MDAKKHPGIYLFAVALAVVSFSASAGTGCNINANKRVVIGHRPTAATLYSHIQNVGAGSWQAGFDTETFVYIGDVHIKPSKSGEPEKIYKIGHLKTIATRQCIEFDRLFIFGAKDEYLGQYAPVEVNAKKIKIQGTSLVFPFHKKDGNTLDLKDGPPAKTQLDGDEVDWAPNPNPAPPL